MAEGLSGAGGTITPEEARYDLNMPAVYEINNFVFHLFHSATDRSLSLDD